MRRSLRFLLILASLMGLGRCTPEALQPPPEAMPVFVSVLPLKAFVEEIGGKYVKVSAMVGSGQSPETYEPLPQQMVELAKAKIFFRVGVPFEQVWMAKIQEINPHLEIVDLRQGIPLQKMHSHEDPHIWNSPPLAKTMAQTIFETLAKLAPKNTNFYQKHNEALQNNLNALHASFRAQLNPYKGRKFLVFHPAWGYFAKAYGLEQIAIEKAGKDPGPQDIAAIIDKAKAENIRVVFVQKQFSQTQAQSIAEAIGGQVIALDPLAEDYFASMRQLPNELEKAFKKTAESPQP